MSVAHGGESCATSNKYQEALSRNTLTTQRSRALSVRSMSEVTEIHRGKQPRRPHHIADWAELRGLKQADIARETGADKSVVSRWFNGATPGIEWQQKLAALFQTDPESLFRHPDDDWLKRFFEERTREEIERIKATLETAFPRKSA